MAELAVEPLPSGPLDWQPEDMWAWVNRVRPLLEAGRCRGAGRGLDWKKLLPNSEMYLCAVDAMV